MTKVKHTPGPWEISYRESGFIQDGHVIMGNDLEIAHVEPWERMDDDAIEEAEANAELIAAAPDLLDALMHLLHDFEEEVQSVDSDSWSFGDPGSWTDAITKARAAIKKATQS
jgi:hypothetical protein